MSRIGVQTQAVGGYLCYLGVPFQKVAKIFTDTFDLKITHPSLLAFNTEQAKNGASLYEAIKQSIRNSPCVNADETGWRVDGQNHWLWVFTNKDTTLYQIVKSRGSKVVGDVLGEKYHGTLISDFYSAYNKHQAKSKQRCLGHLLAEIKKVEEKNKLTPESIDGMFCQELFVFLDDPRIKPTNNRAERQLRPNVIMRKTTFGNRSASGALNQAVMMSILQTGVLNCIEPLDISLVLSVKPLASFTELPKISSP